MVEAINAAGTNAESLMWTMFYIQALKGTLNVLAALSMFALIGSVVYWMVPKG